MSLLYELPPPILRDYTVPSDLVQTLNLRLLYREDGGTVKLFCPAHKDVHKGNLVVYPDHTYCFVCGFTETALDHIRRAYSTNHTGRVIALADQLRKGGGVKLGSVTPPAPVPPSMVNEYVQMLDRKLDGYLTLKRRYGLPLRVQQEAKLGFSESASAFTIPIYDLQGGLSNIRFRSEKAESPVRYWGLVGHNGVNIFFPPYVRVGKGTLLDHVTAFSGRNSLLLVESEFDALALYSMGIPAVALTGVFASLTKGNKLPLSSVEEHLRGTSLFVCFDQDEAGVLAGSNARAMLEEDGFPCKVIRWDRALGKDTSELLAAGYDGKRFRKLIQVGA